MQSTQITKHFNNTNKMLSNEQILNDLYSLSDNDYKQFDMRVDFYAHLEHLIVHNCQFDASILDTINLRNLKLNHSSPKRVKSILNSIKLASNYDDNTKIMFIRALVCWEAQFQTGLEVNIKHTIIIILQTKKLFLFFFSIYLLYPKTTDNIVDM